MVPFSFTKTPIKTWIVSLFVEKVNLRPVDSFFREKKKERREMSLLKEVPWWLQVNDHVAGNDLGTIHSLESLRKKFEKYPKEDTRERTSDHDEHHFRLYLDSWNKVSFVF